MEIMTPNPPNKKTPEMSLCEAIASTGGVWHPFKKDLSDTDLRSFINDNIEPKELSLLSNDEIDYYLKIHEKDGLRNLMDLMKIDFSKCQMRYPLFTDDLKRKILNLNETVRNGVKVDFNDGLEQRTSPLIIGIPYYPALNDILDETLLFTTCSDLSNSRNKLRTTACWELHFAEDKEITLFDRQYFLPSNPSANADFMLKRATDIILREAFLRAFKPHENEEDFLFSSFLDGLMKKYEPFTITLDKHHSGFYIKIEADLSKTKKDKKQLAFDLKELLSEIKTIFSTELSLLMTNHNFVQTIFDTVALENQIGSNDDRPCLLDLSDNTRICDDNPLYTSFEDPFELAVTHINRMREIVEMDDRKKRFIDALTELVKHYQKENGGFTAPKIALIKTEDMSLGYSAIYDPTGPIPTIYIAMSAGGKGTLQSVDDLLNSLGSALALHRAARKKIDRSSQEFHDLDQDITEWLKTKYKEYTDFDEILTTNNLLPVESSQPAKDDD
jgi:hypothetical protein